MALGKLVGGRAAGPGDQRAHLRDVRVDDVVRFVDPPLGGEPAARRERCAPHDPGGPDVAEDAALVADPVHQARLVEQFVELRAMLLGHLGADVRDLLLHVRLLDA